MPFTRCRHFDNNGNAINGGCYNEKDCRFVHPSHPRWEEARRSDHFGGGRGRGRGESAVRGRPRNQAPSKVADSSWDPSSWGPSNTAVSSGPDDDPWSAPNLNSLSSNKASTFKTSSRRTSDTSEKGPTKNRWDGSSNAWGNSSNATSSKKNARGADDTGWGNSSGGSGRGGGESSGWGGGGESSGWSGGGESSGWGGGDDSSGWGGGGGGSGWGGGGESSGWGGGGGGSGWGSDGESNGWGDSGQSRKSSLRHEVQKPNSKTFPGAGGHNKGDEVQKAGQVVIPTDGNPKATLYPTKEPATPHLPPQITAASGHVATVPTAVKLHIQTTSFATVGSSSSVLSDSARTYDLETPSRVHTFASTIKYVQQAVRLQLELDEVQAQVERWKTTQMSAQYTRATTATRKRLDDERTKLAQEAAEISKRLKHSIGILADCQDLSKSTYKPLPSANEDQLMRYTAQLMDWIKLLHVYKHATSLNPPQITPTQDQPLPLIKSMQLSATELENRTDFLIEQLDSRRQHPNATDVETMATLVSTYGGAQKSRLAIGDDQIAGLSQKAVRVGDKLGEQALLVAELYSKIHHNEQNLQALKCEKESLDALRFQVESCLTLFDQWHKEDTTQIQDLLEQIQNLHTLRWPSPPPFDVDGLLAGIRQIVLESTEKEVVPVVAYFRSFCEKDDDRFLAELYQKLQPTLDLVDNIYRRAEDIPPKV